MFPALENIYVVRATTYLSQQNKLTFQLHKLEPPVS